VRITGVGFFDYIHGQHGVAPKQMADQETILAVIDNPKPVRRPGAGQW
jgi:hypothetical protein